MVFNLHDIKQDIQSEVEKLLDFVTGEEAQSATVAVLATLLLQVWSRRPKSP